MNLYLELLFYPKSNYFYKTFRLLYTRIDSFGLKSKQSNNSIDASQSASSTTSHSGSNSSRHNQNKNNRNNGNSGSLSPPNQLPPPPPISSSTGSTQSKYLSKDIEHHPSTANSR